VYLVACFLVVGEEGNAMQNGTPPSSGQGENPFEVANKVLKHALASEILTKAQEVGIEVNLDGMVYASGGQVMLVNIPILGIEQLTLEDLQRGAMVLFLYLTLPPEAVLRGTSQRVPAGFYLVRVTSNRADMMRVGGNALGEVPVQLEVKGVTDDRRGSLAVSVSGGVENGCVSAGVELTRKKLSLLISLKVCS